MVFEFKLITKQGEARAGEITTSHGVIETPIFMPVATQSAIKALSFDQLDKCGAEIILSNTYHLHLRPGENLIHKAGGLHQWTSYNKPFLTDSGGFQIFSQSRLGKCQINDKGAEFIDNVDGKKHFISPEDSIIIQNKLGADIIMAFDQCTPDHCTREQVQHIMTRTHRWLKQSMAYHQQHPTSQYGAQQALFGIIQGGIYDDLRRESADFVAAMNTDGIAIGGETIGFDMKATVDVIRWVKPFLPEKKPRYTMGVGMSPQDLLDVVAEGVDMFDCVAPTRNARHGALYCGEVVKNGNWLKFASEHENARIQIKKVNYAHDLSPIMNNCECYTCKNYSRSYLHHLFKQKANLFTALASIHNVHVLHDVCARMRQLISDSE